MPVQDEYDAETHKVLNPIFGKVLLLRPDMMKDESSFLEMDITEEQRKTLVEKLEEALGADYKAEGAEATSMTNVRTVFEWYKQKKEA